jgi:hypothetical protein
VMFWNALHPCDVSNAEIYTLQQDSRRFDTQTGIGEAYANDHAMAKPVKPRTKQFKVSKIQLHSRWIRPTMHSTLAAPMSLHSINWQLECTQLWIFPVRRTLIRSRMDHMFPSRGAHQWAVGGISRVYRILHGKAWG